MLTFRMRSGTWFLNNVEVTDGLTTYRWSHEQFKDQQRRFSMFSLLNGTDQQRDEMYGVIRDYLIENGYLEG